MTSVLDRIGGRTREVSDEERELLSRVELVEAKPMNIDLTARYDDTPLAVWKYPLPLADGPEYSFMVPVGAKPLHVDLQNDDPALWMLVDPKASRAPRYFFIAGTGHPEVRSDDTYIGTCLMRSGAFVWHVFERAQRGL